MPIPADKLPLRKAQFVIHDATGERAWACNCGNQRADRKLRYINAHPDEFSLAAPTPAAKPAPKAAP